MIEGKRDSVSSSVFDDDEASRPSTTTSPSVSSECGSDDGKPTDKPNHSYISLIANAILASPEKRLVLSDIYKHVVTTYEYFRDKGSGWRNSIRHNLSLNDCFVKSGRSPNGKGHYWAINAANFDDFSRGDFRRRRAQRRARRTSLSTPYPMVAAHHPVYYQYPRFYQYPAAYATQERVFGSHGRVDIADKHFYKMKKPSSAFRLQSEKMTPTETPKSATYRPFDIENLLKTDSSKKCEKDTRNYDECFEPPTTRFLIPSPPSRHIAFVPYVTSPTRKESVFRFTRQDF